MCSSYTVTKRLEHDPTAFTQGLEFEAAGMLIESTGLYGKSQLRRIELNDTLSTSLFLLSLSVCLSMTVSLVQCV